MQCATERERETVILTDRGIAFAFDLAPLLYIYERRPRRRRSETSRYFRVGFV